MMTLQSDVSKRNPGAARQAVVIGGGISGLSAAYFLSRTAAQEHRPLQITVLEASNRWGGVLRTLTRAEVRMEAGADAFYSGPKDTLDLCSQLGLQEEVIEAAPCFRRFFALKNKDFYPFPGLSRSPADIFRCLGSPDLSFQAKCRVLAELFVPCRKEGGDESLANFIRRRLGQDFYRELLKPLVQGVFMMDPERMSLEALFPRLQQAEKTYGSLAGAFLNKRSREEKGGSAGFFTLRQGLEGLIHALVRALEECELRLSAPVRQCVHKTDWEILMENGSIYHADLLGLAVNASDASKLLAAADPALSEELSSIRYDSLAAVNLAYKTGDLPVRVPDFGFLVPLGGERCPFSSLKWLGKDSGGQHVLMRAFLSERMVPQFFHDNDEMLSKKIETFMADFFKIRVKPLFMEIERYPGALPQYETGHFDRLKRIEEKALSYPGLFFAGNAFRGFGITDCIRQARIAVSGLRFPGS